MRLLALVACVCMLSQADAYAFPRTFSVQRRLPLQQSVLFMNGKMDDVRADGENRMKKSIESLKINLATIRAGKVS